MKNDYEIRGDVVAIFIDSKYGLLETLISKKQLKRADEFPNKWYVRRYARREDTFYVQGAIKINGKSTAVQLHRWLTHAPKGMEVDHINHNTLDNRYENLRVVSVAENQQNRRGAPRNSTTRIRGVHWHKGAGKWEAQYKLNGKKITVGYFEDIKEAEKAIIEARRINMPFSQADIS